MDSHSIIEWGSNRWENGTVFSKSAVELKGWCQTPAKMTGRAMSTAKDFLPRYPMNLRQCQVVFAGYGWVVIQERQFI